VYVKLVLAKKTKFLGLLVHMCLLGQMIMIFRRTRKLIVILTAVLVHKIFI
jgi:hypothetical protein